MAVTLNPERKGATEYTKNLNRQIFEKLDNVYTQKEDEDIAEIKKHLVLNLEDKDITDDDGKIIWSQKNLKFIDMENVPETINPYLWRNYRNLTTAGVFEVSDGFYIVVGIDSATIAFIKSRTGWIVQDCCTNSTNSAVSMRLVEQVTGENIHDNIRAVIYSHTHPDHLGGAASFISEDRIGKASEGKIPVYAPDGFEGSLIDENLYTGIPMNRRIQYQCGFVIPHDEKGWISNGVHVTFGAGGPSATILPTELIKEDMEIEIDGVRVTFILTPDTETKAHMCTYFNDYKAIYLGDNGVGVMHNVYTMRGTPVRNANNWAKAFYHLYKLFGHEAQTVFPGHGLPQFNSKEHPDNVRKYLLDNAAAYKYTNDQALLMANEGYNMNEIGNNFEVPESITRTWYTQGIYGQYAFNAKAAYQKYLGFYDGNPVNLAPLAEKDRASKLIEYIGSKEAALEKAKADFEKGNYQWVAEITSHLVYNNPENLEARYLCADALEQLGYQEENAIRRNAYLSGAIELRNPGCNQKITVKPMGNDKVVPYVSAELILDYLGINFDGLAASELELDFVLAVTDDNKNTEYHSVRIYRGTVLHEKVGLENTEESVIEITKFELYLLASKKYNGNNDILKKISEYVVDTSEYAQFNLIEPISQLRNKGFH